MSWEHGGNIERQKRFNQFQAKKYPTGLPKNYTKAGPLDHTTRGQKALDNFKKFQGVVKGFKHLREISTSSQKGYNGIKNSKAKGQVHNSEVNNTYAHAANRHGPVEGRWSKLQAGAKMVKKLANYMPEGKWKNRIRVGSHAVKVIAQMGGEFSKNRQHHNQYRIFNQD
jgi:hypothetical protein